MQLTLGIMAAMHDPKSAYPHRLDRLSHHRHSPLRLASRAVIQNMAGNKNSGRRAGYRHLENTRQKIRAGMIIARMQEDFFTSITPDGKAPKGRKRPLTALQVRIGESLLRKVVPDLQGVVLSGDAENPVVTKIIEEVVDPKG